MCPDLPLSLVIFSGLWTVRFNRRWTGCKPILSSVELDDTPPTDPLPEEPIEADPAWDDCKGRWVCWKISTTWKPSSKFQPNLIDFERLNRFPSTSTANQGITGLKYDILQNKLNKTLPKGNLLSLKGNWLLVNLKWYLRGGMNNNSVVGVHLPI